MTAGATKIASAKLTRPTMGIRRAERTACRPGVLLAVSQNPGLFASTDASWPSPPNLWNRSNPPQAPSFERGCLNSTRSHGAGRPSQSLCLQPERHAGDRPQGTDLPAILPRVFVLFSLRFGDKSQNSFDRRPNRLHGRHRSV